MSFCNKCCDAFERELFERFGKPLPSLRENSIVISIGELYADLAVYEPRDWKIMIEEINRIVSRQLYYPSCLLRAYLRFNYQRYRLRLSPPVDGVTQFVFDY